MFKIAEIDHCSSNPSSDPGSDPSSNSGSKFRYPQGLLPFEYSHKTPACNKYIANIFAASFGRFATTRNFSFGIPTE